MRLRPENMRIEIAGEDAIRALREIELVLTSLHRIGSYYAVADDAEKKNYDRETTRFVDEWKVTAHLAEARAILSRCFDLTLGDDNMDDVEREMECIDYWSNPESVPRKG